MSSSNHPAPTADAAGPPEAAPGHEGLSPPTQPTLVDGPVVDPSAAPLGPSGFSWSGGPDFRAGAAPARSRDFDADATITEGGSFAAGALDPAGSSGPRNGADQDSGDGDADDASVAPMQDRRLGTMVGRFRILARLGRGGMGVVYEADDDRLGRHIAIKILPEDLAEEAQAVRRFFAEARSAGRVNHPNVVRIYEVGRDERYCWLAMEHMAGGSAWQQIAGGSRLHWRQATRIVRQIAAGLHAAHQQGLVHRDIKPSNVLLDAEGTAKLADFGLAKAWLDAARTGMTATGAVLGTPAYMSPEQCNGRPADARSDLYGLGMTWFALLTGRQPFADVQSPPQLLFAQCFRPLPDPRTVASDIPPALVAVLAGAVAKSPDRRWSDAAVFGEALDRLLDADEASLSAGDWGPPLAADLAPDTVPPVASRGVPSLPPVGHGSDATASSPGTSSEFLFPGEGRPLASDPAVAARAGTPATSGAGARDSGVRPRPDPASRSGTGLPAARAATASGVRTRSQTGLPSPQRPSSRPARLTGVWPAVLAGVAVTGAVFAVVLMALMSGRPPVEPRPPGAQPGIADVATRTDTADPPAPPDDSRTKVAPRDRPPASDPPGRKDTAGTPKSPDPKTVPTPPQSDPKAAALTPAARRSQVHLELSRLELAAVRAGESGDRNERLEVRRRLRALAFSLKDDESLRSEQRAAVDLADKVRTPWALPLRDLRVIGAVQGLHFTGDGARLLVTVGDGAMLLDWAARGDDRRVQRVGRVLSAAPTPDGKRILCAEAGTARGVCINVGEADREAEFAVSKGAPILVAAGPRDGWVAGTAPGLDDRPGELFVFQLPSPGHEGDFKVFTRVVDEPAVTALCFIDDGAALAYLTADRRLHIRGVDKEKGLSGHTQFDDVTVAAAKGLHWFATIGRLVVLDGDGHGYSILVADPPRDPHRYRLGPPGHAGVFPVPSGRLINIHADGRMHLLDAATGKALLPADVEAPRIPETAPGDQFLAAVSPDGRWLATATAGKSDVRIWRLDVEAPSDNLPGDDTVRDVVAEWDFESGDPTSLPPGVVIARGSRRRVEDESAWAVVPRGFLGGKCLRLLGLREPPDTAEIEFPLPESVTTDRSFNIEFRLRPGAGRIAAGLDGRFTAQLDFHTTLGGPHQGGIPLGTLSADGRIRGSEPVPSELWQRWMFRIMPDGKGGARVVRWIEDGGPSGMHVQVVLPKGRMRLTLTAFEGPVLVDDIRISVDRPLPPAGADDPRPK